MTFDQFWSIYPRRVGKAAAQKVWNRYVEAMKVSPEAIIEGAKVYAAAKRGTDMQYVAHATTWLNQQRWLDEPAAATVETDEPERKTNDKAIQIKRDTELAHDRKREIIEATRLAHRASVSAAAGRLGVEYVELWSAMLPGTIGIWRRAWAQAKAEVLENAEPLSVLPIERKHWLDGKDRMESRLRHIRGPHSLHISALPKRDMEDNHQSREMIDEDN